MKKAQRADTAREFGQRVKCRRKQARRTQGWCADQVPCSIRTWQRVENGLLPEDQHARVKLQQHVARVLGCTVAELHGKPTPPREGGGHTESDPDTLSIEQYRQLLLLAPTDAAKHAQLTRVRTHLRNQITLFLEMLMVERGLLPQERGPAPHPDTHPTPSKGEH